MLFSSIVFLYYFLPITMGIYWILPKQHRNSFCFLASLVFYAWGEPSYIVLMLLSILVNYGLGRRMEEEGDRKASLVLALVFNLGLLLVFKYTGFIVANINSLTGLDLSPPPIRLPLGISFYTFQALSYVIDVYRGEAEAQESFMKLGLYIAAFPQLVAGPIVRYTTVMDQIDHRTLTLDKLRRGLGRFSLGLGKKVILANQLAQIADWSFVRGDSPSTLLAAWLGILAYSLQIYYDFSGYSDMAIGLGLMLGFEYEENFDYPYMATSIGEFWRRWHISLGRWFRDYLYIPLGGNRVKKSRHIFNLFVVWLMTGLWHGAEWTFIVWGLYYFVLLVAESYLGILKRIPKLVRRVLTLVLVAVGWVLFRADSLADALAYLQAMFNLRLGGHRLLGARTLIHDYWYIYLLGILGSSPIFKHIWQGLKGRSGDRIYLDLLESLGMVVILFWTTMYLVNSSYNPFIYFRF